MARVQTNLKSLGGGVGKPPTNERILLAAAYLFSQQGFAGTSTRDIAERVGITQPGLYRHFKSKDEIFYELAVAIIEPWAQRAEAEITSDGNVAVRLARLVRGICLDIIQSPYPAAFLLTEPAFKSVDLKPVRRIYRRVERTIDQLLKEGMANKVFRENSASLSRHAIMSLTDLLIFPAEGAPEEKINHIVEFALRGVLQDATNADEIIATSQI
jgi:AcrR family transcriptional regulator